MFQKNVLCATPKTVMSYPAMDRYVIDGVASPCVFVRQSPRERGDHGWNFRLTPGAINLLVSGIGHSIFAILTLAAKH